MKRDLTQSAIDRQNILINSQAIEIISSKLGFNGLLYNEEYKFTTKMVAEFYEVDVRTVKRYVENFEDELGHNGYVVIKGAKLKEFKELFGHLMSASDDDVSQRDTDVPLSKQNIDNQSYKKIKALAVFNFTEYMNLDAMRSFCMIRAQLVELFFLFKKPNK